MSGTEMSPPRPTRVDGRRLRSERTKQSIMDAYIELLRQKPEIPTAAQIAARAGISTRSIFERFVDLKGLSLATLDYAFTLGEAQAIVRNVDGDRPARLRSHVETRAGTCERGVALWRVLIFSVDQDEDLKPRIRIARERTIERMEIMYRPELSTLSERDRKHILIALEAITDIESWARMRELYGLSFEEACGVWIRAIDRMLPPTPSN